MQAMSSIPRNACKTPRLQRKGRYIGTGLDKPARGGQFEITSYEQPSSFIDSISKYLYVTSDCITSLQRNKNKLNIFNNLP